jgi:hypothetical protein
MRATIRLIIGWTFVIGIALALRWMSEHLPWWLQ